MEGGRGKEGGRRRRGREGGKVGNEEVREIEGASKGRTDGRTDRQTDGRKARGREVGEGLYEVKPHPTPRLHACARARAHASVSGRLFALRAASPPPLPPLPAGRSAPDPGPTRTGPEGRGRYARPESLFQDSLSPGTESTPPPPPPTHTHTLSLSLIHTRTHAHARPAGAAAPDPHDRLGLPEHHAQRRAVRRRRRAGPRRVRARHARAGARARRRARARRSASATRWPTLGWWAKASWAPPSSS